MEIVDQPLGGGCNFGAGLNGICNVLVGPVQHRVVLDQSSGKLIDPHSLGRDHLGRREAASVLLKALDAKEFLANWLLIPWRRMRREPPKPRLLWSKFCKFEYPRGETATLFSHQ